MPNFHPLHGTYPVLLLIGIAFFSTPAYALAPHIPDTCLQTYADGREAGWPCKPFENPDRVVKWVRAKLLYNGFRPSTRVFLSSTRRIGVTGIQDGNQIYGGVVRSGPREITIMLTVIGGGGSTYRFTLSFPP